MANQTQDFACLLEPLSSVQRSLAITGYSVILIAALIGNILVFVIVGISSRNTINTLLVSRAVSDIAIPIMVATRRLYELSANTEQWPVKGNFGNFLCKFVYFVSDLSPMVSVLSLVLMSLDRLLAVVYPFQAAKYADTNARKYFLAATWLFAGAFCSPYFYAFHVNELGSCVSNWSPAFDHATAQNNYITATIVLFIILPFITLTVIYSVIWKTLRNRPEIGQESERKRKSIERTKRNVFRLSVTVVLLFAICWLPYFSALITINYVWKFQFTKVQCWWFQFQLVATFLAHSNAAINPYIYFIFLGYFRDGLKNLFSCMQSKRSNASDQSNTSVAMKQL